MSSAQLHIHPDDELAIDPASPLPPFELTEPELRQPALRQHVAERVAAHRARRGQTSPDAQPQTSPNRPSRTRSAHIAATVAERYAHSQSYRAFLASEAERAVHQAHAVAQVATINAQAIAVAQQQLLTDLENWDMPSEMTTGPVGLPNIPLSQADFAALFDRDPSAPKIPPRETSFVPAPAAVAPATFFQPQSFTVRPYEDAAHPVAPPHLPSPLRVSSAASYIARELDEDERLALDEEIAFRHDPIFNEATPGEPTPANLIEFPRQLIAARKARPRLAEGPLRDEDSLAAPQLRIFEVEADQLSFEPIADAAPPEWSSILLSALPVSEFSQSPDADYLPDVVPQPAVVSRRIMATFVDACLVLAVQVAFTALFAYALTHLSGEHAVLEIPRTLAILGVVTTFAILVILYQVLFFTLSDATPGMRYARIALCTLSDENPTRSAMRRRIFATLLAAFPLGLGLLWAFLDEDTLGWHDRMSRMYQRAY